VPGISYDGGYAEYMVAPVEALARIPGDLSGAEAAPLLCAGITTFNALRHSGARPGEVAAILGIGGLGHLAVQFAAKMGFATVAIARGKVTSGKAMNAAAGGLAIDGKLMIVGVSEEQVSPLQLITGRRSVQGWPSGTAADSQDTLGFSALAGVRLMIEEFPLERAAEAYDRMISGGARFRVVLKTG
jgi:D-arabinose 1-dehydrogenase-like Zn-dependent alcohol dehydrogenase